jgi:hypothetical protein
LLNGTIYEIRLSDKSPHPHASIEKISKFAYEKEVLLLPYFPLKEVSRRNEGDLTFIQVI